jgi:DNA replication protein DnaD
MRQAYPKHPREIPIRIINRSIEDGLLSGIATTAEVALAEKMSDYLLRLGYSSAHITGIIVQLLTKGKVRVDFREYTERLELISPSDQLNSAQAMTLLEDFITEISTPEDTQPKTTNSTQRIVVQLPKGGRKV